VQSKPTVLWQGLRLPKECVGALKAFTSHAQSSSGSFDQKSAGRQHICALFEGGNVADRKMAAQSIATGVGRVLHEVNLSRVAKKYIGETEKNLSKVFDSAERNHWVLFFDEADALLGKRTQVNDSHDRYANAATDYLAQRLDAYRGIAILATHTKSSLNPAFLRLFQHVILFPSPGTDCS